jgi:hypothetical protein
MRGDGQNQLQISAPLPLKEILRMIPLSAQPISLDSPFKSTVIAALANFLSVPDFSLFIFHSSVLFKSFNLFLFNFPHCVSACGRAGPLPNLGGLNKNVGHLLAVGKATTASRVAEQESRGASPDVTSVRSTFSTETRKDS